MASEASQKRLGSSLKIKGKMFPLAKHYLGILSKIYKQINTGGDRRGTFQTRESLKVELLLL